MNKSLFFRIISYLFPYKKQFIIGSIFAFLFSLMNGLTLYSVVPIFDTLTPGEGAYQIEISRDEAGILAGGNAGDTSGKIILLKAQLKKWINNLIYGISKFDLLIYICSCLFIIIIIRILFELLSVYYIGYAGYGAIRDIRKSLYFSILYLPLTFFHRYKTGDLISKIINNTDLISGSLSNQLRKFIMNLFIVITHVALLLYINPELTLYAFITLLLITVPILLMGRAFRRYSRIEQEKMSELSTLTLETIEGIRIIKSYHMENIQTGRFHKYAKILYNKKIKKSIIDITRPQIIEIIASIFLVFLFIYGGGKTIAGDYTKGEFMFFVLTFLFIMNPIKQIANMNNQIKQAEAAGETIFNIIDHEKEIRIIDYEKKKYLKPLLTDIITPVKTIKFDHISFRYPGTDKYVLNDIYFNIEAGKTLAVVGRSGAGKTTLLDLLPRFFEPSEGRILIDDIDIKSLDLGIIRNSIGIVTQDIFLFNGTIAENIAYGRDDISMEEIKKAAEIANAHEFIMKTPEGYRSTVGERGIMLSGGERQRIAIARSILRNPPILIMDEATSSLDTESERLVQDALNRLMRSRTSFIIAHRLSTIVNADLIIVIEDSSIAEYGTHETLLEKNGIYKKLYDIQFSEG